jgi:hypothetical protein
MIFVSHEEAAAYHVADEQKAVSGGTLMAYLPVRAEVGGPRTGGSINLLRCR